MGKRKYTSGKRVSKAVAKFERKVEVANELGLHLRAAVEIAKVADKFLSDVYIVRNKSRANAKSVLSVASLGALKQTKLKIVAQGRDAKEAVEAISRLFKEQFGEGR